MSACKTFSESFEKMFTVATEKDKLKALTLEHPGRIENNFDILCRYAPTIALEPSVAAAWVRAISQQGLVSHVDVRSLCETQMKIWEMAEKATSLGVNLSAYGKGS